MRTHALIVAGLLAVGVGIAPAQAQGRRGNVAGTIKSVDTGAKSFVVTARRMGQETAVTVMTNDQTRFMKGADEGTLAALAEGKFVVVAGQGAPDTGITAREVIVLDRAGGSSTGTVKSFSGGTLVITAGRAGQEREISIKTTDKTKVFMGRQAGKNEDVAAGKRVMVIGEGNPRQGDFTAVVIRVLPPANQ